MTAPFAQPRRPDHPVEQMFIDRWSPRAFSDAVLTEAQVLTVLEAARWAPSANNRQPWRLIWDLRGSPGFDAILAALNPGNQAWAGKASALLVIASRQVAERGEELVPNPWASFDTGTAWGHLALQAHLSGLIVHAMGGFDAAALAQAIHLPPDHALHAVVALGYRGDAATLPEPHRDREAPNQRLPLSAIARRGSF